MKQVPRYITSIQVQNMATDQRNIFLGFAKNGAMGLYMSDAAELGQDGSYINELSFPNSGLLVHGKYSMWVSMFARHVTKVYEDFDEE
ncbi:MAG: hypothetical protein OIN89_08330 [Candidatus Methanoperedens sp.]|jgi:hypothetical protein|nr:hypothetical protein [Candidatus Methanoperedens sp.]PKL53385.1 MAG: hypothetical protein CVV36_07360 [Candidatus Methanoperedenaceae archaeon HGW-Methanoperedenaceae-1]